MKIFLENASELEYIAPILYQFEQNDFFMQAIAGISNKELIIYNDNEPDEVIKDKGYNYRIKAKVSLEDISIIRNENIKGKALKHVNRLHFINKKDLKKSFFIYYYKNDKKEIGVLLKRLKYKGIKMQKGKFEYQSTVA